MFTVGAAGPLYQQQQAGSKEPWGAPNRTPADLTNSTAFNHEKQSNFHDQRGIGCTCDLKELDVNLGSEVSRWDGWRKQTGFYNGCLRWAAEM
jgi:hypothetical protein